MKNTEINFTINSWEACAASLTFCALKDPATELGGIMKDCLHECRLRLNSIFEKYHKICDDRNITKGNSRTIDPKFGILWYQSAALEGDNTLQELWANLLAKATDKNFKGDLKIAFIEILKTLTPTEVLILQAYHDFIKAKSYKDTSRIVNIELYLDKDNLVREFNISELELEASLLNLERCQLITTFQSQGNVYINGQPSVKKSPPHLTELGILFIRACIEQ